MQLNINLPPPQIDWATSAFQRAVDARQTTATSVVEWMEGLYQDQFQSQLDHQVIEAANSWKPEETAEVVQRRDEVTKKLDAVSEAQLQQVEAILSVSADEPDEVAQRRADALKKLASISEDGLKSVEETLKSVKDEIPVDAGVAVDVKP